MNKIYKLSFIVLGLSFLFLNQAVAQCSASFNYTLNTGGNVSFESTSTGTTTTMQYFWSFGDSNNGNGATTNHTYNANGTYTVMLSMYDTAPPNCSATAVQTIAVSNASCNLIAGFNFTINTNGAVDFESTSTGTTATTNYTWSYGDNTFGSGATSSHTYASNGNYWVYFQVDNGNNCMDSIAQQITISNVPCNLTANFTYSNYANGYVTFSNTSTGTSSNTNYKWKINHAYFSSGQTSANTFTNNTYSITLVVTNPSYTPACVDSITQVVSVSNNTCSVNASFTYTQNANGVFNFASTSTGTTSGMVYYWNFGDGNQVTIGAPVQTHTYTNAGNYPVSFLVYDPNNTSCYDSLVTMITVTTVPCVANSNFSLTQISTGYWNAIPAYPYNIVSATWNWGDNTSTNALWANHTYSPTGMYTICLTVSVSCGATSTTCASYSITRTSEPMSMAYVNVVAPQIITLGLKDNFNMIENDVAIYPNPNTGSFDIKILDPNIDQGTIEIHSMTGQLVYQANLESQNGVPNKHIQLDTYQNGVYFVKLKLDNNVITKKIILQK